MLHVVKSLEMSDNVMENLYSPSYRSVDQQDDFIIYVHTNMN